MSQRKNALHYLKKWTYLLGLRWWKVDVYFLRKKGEITRTFGKRENETVIAKTFADWRYATATIYINLRALNRASDEEVETYIVHELCHILVNEMRDEGIDHEERTVTGLQKAFIWTRTLKDEDAAAAA